jgi:hypothetical protein
MATPANSHLLYNLSLEHAFLRAFLFSLQAATSFRDASTAVLAAENSASESKPATLHFTSSLSSVARPSTALFAGVAVGTAGAAAAAATSVGERASNGSKGVPQGVSSKGGSDGAGVLTASTELTNSSDESP